MSAAGMPRRLTERNVRTEGGVQLGAPWWEPCCPSALHFDCKRCGRLFCSRCEGGADDLADGVGLGGSEVCDTCWAESSGDPREES